MRRHIETTGEVGHIIDETITMKTYSKIVGELYHRAKYAELPALQSNEVLLLSHVFHRNKKDEVPMSSTRTWIQPRANSDGNSCMSVIESIFMVAKMAPEAMLHPMSRLITAMDQPAVVETPNGPTYAIPSDTRIGMTPAGFETFCSWLKKKTLKTYVKHRLSGDSEMSTSLKMSATMKDTEMFDSKNLHRGRRYLAEMSTPIE
ncbi:hypothetical protein V8C40DRAFT_179803 [Trichoderma camerunense]